MGLNFYKFEMDKTKKRLSRYWDRIFLRAIPPYVRFEKVEKELEEHFNFLKWMFKRVVLPLILFYVVMSLVFNMNVFGSLFISFIIFIYSNFLPDVDFLIKRTIQKNRDSLWYEKYFLLFFAPVVIYYVIRGRAKPLYSLEDRCFHNFRTVLVYGFFLLIVGSIFWPETLKRVMLPLFGMMGFIFHLIVDGTYAFLRKKMKK